ncbi:hypothetical protein NDU88_010735 [Pleurodeles waltl]|uniref:Uncharacterized protein n=1 Tax=Pleurodeles waltl TaxID=8319 RepID=A0AAV7PZ97_PLEWA|nr:hypothetical protein NDU88_010735 [Pleurodeles waltl]
MQSCAQASRPPSRPGGRFRHRAHFAVTRGALSRLAPSWMPQPGSPLASPGLLAVVLASSPAWSEVDPQSVVSFFGV